MSSSLRTVVLLAVCALGACKAAPTPAPAPLRSVEACNEAAPEIDAVLMAFLSKARAVHLQADLAEADATTEEAVRLLDELVRRPVPGGEHPGPEVREVLADSLARLAELQGRRGNFDAARGFVQRGLELATEPTQFRGRLFEVRGSVEKQAFEALRERHDEPGAAAAKARSIAALKEAVAIQESVIARALEVEPKR